MSSFPNPVRLLLSAIGLGLARLGLAEASHVRRTVDLSWPRIVTGLARTSKGASDVAMVGVALGPAAIAGVGLAGPYWGFAFALGGGFAAGTIALVSQRYGAGEHDELAQVIRTSLLLVVLASVPVGLCFLVVPRPLVALLTNDPATIRYGARYLRALGPGVPFAALNLVYSRALIGADDAWTPMLLRAGGAVTNIGLNAVFVFGLGLGAVGAGLGTTLSNVLVVVAFVVGLGRGSLPLVGAFPVTVSPVGPYLDRTYARDVVAIGVPVIGRTAVWTVARFPLLAFVSTLGPPVIAAYIVARRVLGLMDTPGWGFGLAASSLVGQALGEGDEDGAATYAREITRFAVATYLVAAALVAAFAGPIVRLFIDDPTSASVPIARTFVYVAAVAVIAKGISAPLAGALDASGDTRWQFYGRLLGMFGFCVPLAYLAATTPLGIYGVYLTFVAETAVPAVVDAYRFRAGAWRRISRGYRPGSESVGS